MPNPIHLIALLVLSVVAVVLVSGAPADAATVECVQEWRPAATPTYLTREGRPTEPAQPLPAAPSPAHRPFHVFCGGHYVNTVWLLTPTNLFEAVRVGRELAAHAMYPSITIAANPTRGITGMASWFWASPDAESVRMRRGNGPALDLELQVASVRWSFGDGPDPTVVGLGTAYPTPSPVRHVFERTGTYTVTGRVGLVGRFSYEELLIDFPGEHTITARHPVAEVRSLLHGS